MDHFSKVKLIETEKQRNFLNSLKTEQNHIMAKLSTIYKKKEATGVPSIYLIVDIFHNAKRRSYQDKFDDAIARLYRCLEIIGQHLLFAEHELLSSDVDLDKIKDKVPIGYYNKLERKKNNEKQKKIEAGLVDDFELLSYLDRNHPVSVQYLAKRDEFKKCLLYRNQSILAHGTTHLTEEKYESLENITKLILKSLFPQVDSKIEEIESCFDFILSNT